MSRPGPSRPALLGTGGAAWGEDRGGPPPPARTPRGGGAGAGAHRRVRVPCTAPPRLDDGRIDGGVMQAVAAERVLARARAAAIAAAAATLDRVVAGEHRPAPARQPQGRCVLRRHPPGLF